MGKSEVERLRPKISTQTGVNLCGPVIQERAEVDAERLMERFEAMENQVAGHMNDGKHIGMLLYGDKVYKPITKPQCGQRETAFYKEITNTTDDMLLEFKQFVPKYYGNETITLGDGQVDCIVLEDLTKHLKEPCIMDVKIGRRTWDPLASYEKIVKEEQKYQDTKRDLGLCITGFQFYNVSNGKLSKYGKEFGKKLNKDTVRDALKSFLNIDSAISRTLLVQFLAILWRIQNWSRKQRKVRLYSSSLLLMYDARRLRNSLEESGNIKVKTPMRKLSRSNSLYRPLSMAALNGCDKIPTGFSGQLTHEGFNLRSCQSPKPIDFPNQVNHKGGDSQRIKAVPTLKRMHSFQNNYDNDLQSMKRDYAYMLEDLVAEQRNEMWVNVKVIDFAHVFPAGNDDADSNYLEGIDNLVKMFEEYLEETDYNL